jgi:predicted amidohydrolase
MKLAILQMQAIAGDVAANLATIEKGVREAASKGVDLIVTPELALTGYGAGNALTKLAEPASGPSIKRLNALAAETGTAIVAGFAEAENEMLWNSAVFVDGARKPVVYRKSHLYGDYEKALCKAAEPTTVMFEHAGQTIGMLICFDVEFPENVRRLAKAGCSVVVAPTALPQGAYARFISRSMLPVRAYENQIFVAYANHAGKDEAYEYAGLSVITAPDGTVLAGSEDSKPALLIADIDPAAYDEIRVENNYLGELK